MSGAHLWRLFGASRQAFYHRQHDAQRVRGHSLRVLDLVRALRGEIPGLGTRKLQRLLQQPLAASGIKIGRDKLHRLWQTHDLLLRQKRAVPKTTNATHSLRKYPDLLVDLRLAAPQQVWVCDITYLGIGLGFGYLSLLTDACSELLVGYCLHALLTVAGSLKAVEMALQSERPGPASLIHHSDRGSQYCRFVYLQRLRQAGIAINVTQHGVPYENAVAERVNGILKTDFRLTRVFIPFDEVARAVEQSVRHYNHLRPHLRCGYLTPAAAHASTEPLQKHWKPKVYKTAQTPLPTDTA